MAEYFALIQKGQKPRQDSVLQSYATAYNLDGRNSRTTGVFSNDAYKSPEIGTAFSLTAACFAFRAFHLAITALRR